MTYLPLFLQVVKGASPTASGLQMLPLMGGSLVTSVVSGQLISRTGRYKVFPLVGTACTSLGLFLLSRMNTETGTLTASLIMLVLGLGLGMVMQVIRSDYAAPLPRVRALHARPDSQNHSRPAG